MAKQKKIAKQHVDAVGGQAELSAAATIPEDRASALQWLTPLLDEDPLKFSEVEQRQFKQAWAAIAYLYPGLHPDDAPDGEEAQAERELGDAAAGNVDPRLVTPYFVESGWPVVLAPLAHEAWRRFEGGLLTDEEMYNADAQLAGMVG